MNLRKDSSFTLQNGELMPRFGFGTWLLDNDEETARIVEEALAAGYVLIDTATVYKNEKAVGQGLKASGLKREDYYVTTKLHNDVRGYEETKKAIAESLELLGLDYLDLYLLHWPVPKKYQDSWATQNAESWRAMEDAVDQGLIKSLGISNFKPHHTEELLRTCRLRPQVNQIKLCPGVRDPENEAYCREQEIVIQAYSPLGRGVPLKDPVVVELSEKYLKTSAQIALRYILQEDLGAIPKTGDSIRIKENIAVFDFELAEEDMAALRALDFPEIYATDPDQPTW